MVVVEAPTLDAFVSRVSNWTITYSIPPSPKPLPCFWFKKKKKKMPDQYNSEYPQLQAPE